MKIRNTVFTTLLDIFELNLQRFTFGFWQIKCDIEMRYQLCVSIILVKFSEDVVCFIGCRRYGLCPESNVRLTNRIGKSSS